VSAVEPRRLAILALLAATQLIGVLDFSIVNVALPSIQAQFGLPPGELQWVVSAYALTLGGGLLLGGRIADLYDRKLVFMAGLAVFSAASLAGGLAPTAPLVFAARAVQGLGGAILMPSALALVTSEFPEGPERNRALGVFGTVASVGFTAGVILGGLLTGVAGWRWVFFVNVPIGLVALAAAWWLLGAGSRREERPPLDVAGAVLATAALVALVGGLSQAGPQPADLLRAAGLVAAAAVLLAAFVAVEAARPAPLVPLAVFRLPGLVGANVVAGLTIAVASALAFTLTLVVQRDMGFSPQVTGLAFLPAGAGGFLGGTLAGRAVHRLGLSRTAAIALAALVGGTAVVLALGLQSILWLAAGYAVVGFGIVGTVVASTIAGTSGVARQRQGLAAGLLSTAQQVGGATGAALAGVAVAAGGPTRYQAALGAAIVLGVGAAATAATTLRHTGRPAAEPARPREAA
jgi:EmrB/QacA subfamily drug resistance transporter